MIRKLWGFLAEPRNLAVLGLIGAAIAFLWKVAEPRWFPADERAHVAPPTARSVDTQTAIATGPGSQALIAAHGSHIGGERGDTLPAAPSTNAPLSQRAEASAGGTAINASRGSQVIIDKKHADQ